MATIKSLEEKARAYDKVREKIAIRFGSNVADEIFSEYEESEDEKIRKELIHLVKKSHEQGGYALQKWEQDSMLVWLEKQKSENHVQWSDEEELHIKELESLVKRVWAIAEHENDKDTIHEMSDLSFFLKTLKPRPKSDWSEEDEMFIHGLIRGLAAKRDIHGHTTFSSDCINITDTINWLKSLKDRIQPKQEWSKKDEKILKDIITDVKYEGYNNDMQANSYKKINWLKSLKPQNAWKPSDEQMKILNEVLNFAANHESSHWNDYIFGTLNNLIRQLKKLREE